MLFDENQHISERQNTAIAQNGPKTIGHAAQNCVTSSQLFWAYYLTPWALYSAPTKLHILKNEETNPFYLPSLDHPTHSPATNKRNVIMIFRGSGFWQTKPFTCSSKSSAWHPARLRRAPGCGNAISSTRSGLIIIRHQNFISLSSRNSRESCTFYYFIYHQRSRPYSSPLNQYSFQYVSPFSTCTRYSTVVVLPLL